MADLEEHAIKRDKKFLVKLVLGLLVGVIAGLLLYAQLTSNATGNCAAGMFGTVTHAPGGQPANAAPR